MAGPRRFTFRSGIPGSTRSRAAGFWLRWTAALILMTAAARSAAALPAVPDGLNPSYQLETRPVGKVTAVYKVSVSAPSVRPDVWILLWPKVADLPGQRIIAGACRPTGVAVSDLSPLHQPLWQVRIPVPADAPGNEVKLTVATRVELFSRKLVRRDGGPVAVVPPLPDDQRRLFLRPTAWFDYESPALLAWLDANKLRRGEREGEVDFGQRVFLTLTRGFGYEYRDGMDRRASHVCGAERSDCGGVSSLFVAAMRSQGVPARMRAGRWALSAKPGQRAGEVEYFQEHVKAEFFAQRVGWVPVDVSSGILHDKTPAGLDYFGNDRGDFITLHLDHDLSFEPFSFGVKTVALLQRAAYWTTGRGHLRDAVIKEGWEVTPIK